MVYQARLDDDALRIRGILRHGPRALRHTPGGHPHNQQSHGNGLDSGDVARVIDQAGERIGIAARAAEIAELHLNPYGELGPEDRDFVELGSGDHRTVYLDPSAEVVYKVARPDQDSANRHEVRYLREAKKRGEPWAPDATLYEVEVEIPAPFADEAPERITATVVAMPYLPEDSSVPLGGRPALGPDFNPANVVANGGQLWLIDAGGI